MFSDGDKTSDVGKGKEMRSTRVESKIVADIHSYLLFTCLSDAQCCKFSTFVVHRFRLPVET